MLGDDAGHLPRGRLNTASTILTAVLELGQYRGTDRRSIPKARELEGHCSAGTWRSAFGTGAAYPGELAVD